MQKSFKRTTITTALPYANGPIHIGHLAGVYIPADIYARYLRNNNEDVLLIGGSDEHGIPITIKAKKENTTPQAVVNKYHTLIKDTLNNFGVSFNHYSRTSGEKHHQVSADFFKTLHNKGVFTEQVTEQFYDESAKEFLADRYVMGECPKCGNPNAYGDQCENCGTTLSPDELINPRSTLSGNIPIKKETKNWYLPLDKYEEFLTEWILVNHKADWKPNVYGQVKSWITEGLKPRAMTRDLEWGVKVPLEEAIGKVLYVWFDAPIGYITSTQEWAEKNNKNWELYWKDKETRLVHFIGKDNIVFHCIIFPVMLKAHEDYILPESVPANEFLNLENDKISTSRNWAVWAHEYLADLPNKEDVLRYVLTANLPETKDNNFTWKDFQTKNNSELVGIFGNFINRITVLTQKYYNGIVPEPSTFQEIDQTVLNQAKEKTIEIGKKIEQYKFRDALAEMMNIARIGNKYLADEEPWKTIKTDQERVKTVIYTSLQIAATLAYCCEPFLPFTSIKLKNSLNLKEDIAWNELAIKTLLISGQQINEPQLLFDKIEDQTIEIQLQKLQNAKQENNKINTIMAEETTKPLEEKKANISYDDFSKLDIRLGTILEAKKVEKADRLLELKVDLGSDIRTIVSGIAESFSPEEVIGKQVMVLANLEPRKIRGIQSKGMILLADKEDGKLTFMAPELKTKNGNAVL